MPSQGAGKAERECVCQYCTQVKSVTFPCIYREREIEMKESRDREKERGVGGVRRGRVKGVKGDGEPERVCDVRSTFIISDMVDKCLASSNPLYFSLK